MNKYRKWVDLFLVLSTAGIGFVLRQIFGQIWIGFNLPTLGSSPIQLPSILGFALAILGFVMVKRQQKAMSFLDEVSQELAKVTWPKGKDTVRATGVIIIMLAIASGILAVFDMLWGTLTNKFFLT